jgi:hypothetical protein
MRRKIDMRHHIGKKVRGGEKRVDEACSGNDMSFIWLCLVLSSPPCFTALALPLTTYLPLFCLLNKKKDRQHNTTQHNTAHDSTQHNKTHDTTKQNTTTQHNTTQHNT